MILMNKHMRHLPILFIALICVGISGCGHRSHHQQNSSGGTVSHIMISDTAQEEDMPDTIHIGRTWSDPEDWLCSAPSAEQIGEWKAICEKCNNGWISRCELEQFADTVQYLAVGDLLNTLVFVYPDVPELGDDFIAWRLSEWYNAVEGFDYAFDSEYDRLAALHDAICSVILYEAGSQMEMNAQSILRERLLEMYTNEIRNTVFRNVPPEQKRLLQAEETAWKKYSDAEWEAYDKLWRGTGFLGSSQPMGDSDFLSDVHSMRQKSLLDFMYAVTDSLDYTMNGHKWSRICGMYEPERHRAFTMEAVDTEYDRFMAELHEDEYSYPLDVQKKALVRNRRAWHEWMDARTKVSHSLSGMPKDIYVNCTNNVRRSKLINLKNRYSAYGVMSEEMAAGLIYPSIDDDDLLKPAEDSSDTGR